MSVGVGHRYRKPTLVVERREAGHYAIVLCRPGQQPQLWRTNIASSGEANRRARIVSDLCGYHARTLTEGTA